MTRRPPRADQDSGAALILAIGFVLAVGTISGGLAGLATSGLNNRQNLKTLRDREYAADGAIEAAISTVRAGTTCVDSSTGVALPVVGSLIPIRVDWVTDCPSVTVQNAATPVDYPLRNVTFSACLNPVPASVCDPANVIIRAVVNFEPATGPVKRTLVQGWSVNR
jgi:hypothetical protein